VFKRGVSPSSISLPLSFKGEALPLRAIAQRGDKGGEVGFKINIKGQGQ